MTWDMNRSSDYKRLMENDDPIQKMQDDLLSSLQDDVREAIAMPEEIKQLREQLAACRRLLREAVERLDYPEIANTWGGWVIAARAAFAQPPPADAQRSEEPHP